MSPVSFYKCLADDTRLKALLLITLKKELCVCELTDALELSQPKISRHLAELRKCQILIDERRGKWVFYRIHPALPEWALSVLKTTASSEPAYLAEAITHLESSDAVICCP